MYLRTEKMADISKIVRRIRKQRGFTQEEMGKILGVSRQYIYQIESGRKSVGLKFLEKFSKVFQIPLSKLLEETGITLTSSDKDYILKILNTLSPEEQRKVLDFIVTLKGIPIKKIPVLGYVQAGEPFEIPEDEEPIEIIELPADETKEAKFAVIVRGDSMKERGIEEGDYLLLNPDIQVESGDLVVAVIDKKATFKIFRRDNGKIYLEPANSNYRKIELKPDMDIKLYKVTGVWVKKK